MKIQDSYPNGACPDCGESIPENAEDGDECKNCEHVFHSSKPENTNCLAGLKCPECGALEPFKIAATMDVIVVDNGTDDYSGDVEWNDAADCMCQNCKFTGIVKDFKAADRQMLNRDELDLFGTLSVLSMQVASMKKRTEEVIPKIIDQLSSIEDLGDHSTLLAFTVGGITSTLSILMDVIGDATTLIEIALNQLPVRDDGQKLIDAKKILRTKE